MKREELKRRGSYIRNRAASFQYAFRGIATLLRQTPNVFIQITVAVLAVLLGFIFSISSAEWVAVIIVTGMVFAFEAVNTAIEQLADFVCKKPDETIKRVKDLSAAAVLIAAIAAAAVGALVYLPKILALFS